MKRVVLLACLAGCFIEPGAPDIPPWQIVQVRNANTHGITIDPVRANDLIVVMPQVLALNTIPAVTDDAGNTYVHRLDAQIDDNGNNGIDLWYAIVTKPGATHIETQSTAPALCVWEVSGIDTSSPFDAAATQVPPRGPIAMSPPISTARDGEFVVAALVTNGSLMQAVDNTFTTDCMNADNVWGHLTSSTAPAGTYAGGWVSDGTGYVASTAAFFTP